MREQFDRYFELVPVLVIALLVLLGEQGLLVPIVPEMDRSGREISAPQSQVEAPRLIFR